MRRLTQQDDRGVTTLFVVLMMPLLLGFAALVLDGGRGIVARRETQNAADAAALAKATDCAKGETTSFTAYETNGAVLANSPTCGSGITTVSMKKNITLMFWPGGGNRDVSRSATAKWGGIQAAAVPSPITIAGCEFSQAILAGTGDVEFFLDDPKPQTGCSSPSGGFGRLTATADAQGDDCITKPVEDTSSGDWLIDGKSGNDLQKIRPCFDKVLDRTSPADRTILIPLYDDTDCGGRCQGNDKYPIKGYAMVLLKGYLIKGQARFPVGLPPSPSTGWCMKNLDDDPEEETNDCIIGDFIQVVLPADLPGVVSGGTNYGATRPYLYS